MDALMLFHVFFGIVALVFGFGALLLKKGSLIHKLFGNIFILSMLAMAIAGSYIAWQKPEMITLLGGLLSCYLVLSGFLAVSKHHKSLHHLHSLLAMSGAGIGIAGLYYGSLALGSTSGVYDGFSAEPYFFFGVISLIAAMLDVNAWCRPNMAYKQRLIRHLWRMCFALFMATASFFTGPGSRLFPDNLRDSFILLAPQLLVLLLMCFWFQRIWRKITSSNPIG